MNAVSPVSLTLVMLSILAINNVRGQWSTSVGWGGAGGGKRSTSDFHSLLGLTANRNPQNIWNPCLDYTYLQTLGKFALAAAQMIQKCNSQEASEFMDE